MVGRALSVEELLKLSPRERAAQRRGLDKPRPSMRTPAKRRIGYMSVVGKARRAARSNRTISGSSAFKRRIR